MAAVKKIHYRPAHAWAAWPTRTGYLLNAFMVFGADATPEKVPSIIHLPTGYRVCKVHSRKRAQDIACALLEKWPLEFWCFTDPRKANKFKGAQSLIREHGGTW